MMSSLSKYIKVSTSFQGFHRYINAPEEVSFLREWHRHLFKIEVSISVDDGNRELEFFIVKNALNAYLQSTFEQKQFELSCEMVAEKIIEDFLKPNYGNRLYKVEVSEDGENTGGVISNPRL